MNSWDRERLLDNLLSPEVCRRMRERVQALPSYCWVKFDRAIGRQGYAGETSRYAYVTADTIPKELSDWIMSLAPQEPSWQLGRMVINRYRPGDWIGKHKDQGTHDLNLIIPLQSGEDGVCIDDIIHPDVVGNGRLHIYNGKAHSVPPVKNERYVVIYFYKEVGIHDQ